MRERRLSTVVRHIRDVLARQSVGAVVDAELLRRYVRQQDQAAFEAIVQRHGRMVLGVCRRVLANEHDAEDAFQATFLILIRKAKALRHPEKLGNWLYGVAYHAAIQARDAAIKRRAKEANVTVSAQHANSPWLELLPVLDKELERLPEKYRLPLVLCDLEGRTRKEVASELGCPEGTVASRLARARATLARRLTRHGVTLTGATLAVLLADSLASACGRPSLVSPSSVFWTGQLSPQVIRLAEGVMKTMLLKRLVQATVVLLIMAVLSVGGSVMLAPSLASDRDSGANGHPKDSVGPVESVDAGALGAVFKQNAAAGDVKFTGRRIRITGLIGRIKSSAVSGSPKRGYVLTMNWRVRQRKDDPFSESVAGGLNFEFYADDRETLAGLAQGAVTIEGKCLGTAIDGSDVVVFGDCKIVQPDK
jgi:RNA polymerase sigma factor (sigma-70 family)